MDFASAPEAGPAGPPREARTLIRRGEIWWASLGPPRGSEPGYRRPVLVLQVDEINRSRIGTVVAVALTTNLRRADAPGNVLLRKRESRLPETSVVVVSQVVTLDKTSLVERVSSLGTAPMRSVESGLRLVLGL